MVYSVHLVIKKNHQIRIFKMLKLFTLLVGIEQAGFPNFGILYLELIVCRVSTEASAAEPTSADEAELAATEPCGTAPATGPAAVRQLLAGWSVGD